MNTRVYGEQTDVVVIEVANKAVQVNCIDSIVKLWFSDGAVLDIKYGAGTLYPDIWKIRVLNPGSEPHMFKQIYKATALYYSDEYETEAFLLDYKVIPISKYFGGA